MILSEIFPYCIIVSIVIFIGYGLARMMRSVRKNAFKSGNFVGLAMAMMAILSVFRDNTSKEKTKITRTTDKKSELD